MWGVEAPLGHPGTSSHIQEMELREEGPTAYPGSFIVKNERQSRSRSPKAKPSPTELHRPRSQLPGFASQLQHFPVVAKQTNKQNKLLDVSEVLFPHLQNGVDNSPCSWDYGQDSHSGNKATPGIRKASASIRSSSRSCCHCRRPKWKESFRHLCPNTQDCWVPDLWL